MMYCKTKSGKIFKIWSDNPDEKTMNVYPATENFDPEVTCTDEIPYSDVVKISDDYVSLKNS